jgi:hypothetical protein
MRKISQLAARGGMGCRWNNLEAELLGPGGRLLLLASEAFAEPGGNSVQPILIHHSHSNIYGQNREV